VLTLVGSEDLVLGGFTKWGCDVINGVIASHVISHGKILDDYGNVIGTF